MINNKKKVVFDTNVLLKNPALINQYRDRLLIPKKVFDELDRLNHQSIHKEKASLAINLINKYDFKFLITRSENKKSNPDEQILDEILENYAENDVVLISDDTGMNVLAKQKKMQTFKHVDFLMVDGEYKITPQLKELQLLLKQQKWDLVKQHLEDDSKLHFNFYLENGYTPLIDAIVNRDIKTVEFLVGLSNINLNLIDKAKLNLSAFSHAAQKKQIPIMKLLIDNGANPYITSEGKNRGNSALLIAAWDGSLDIIQWIAEHEHIHMSLNQSDNNGFTPLIKASIKGHHDIVKYLIRNNVDPFIRDRNAMSALDYAVENKHSAIIEYYNRYLNTFTN
ncbi:ankyrin repeat domain-containing protein [Orbus wheelerorum]|uniref:ankyrin repeat domain-containing protein n=1 Tax=Orbus wheelerorum TaxID=3074111 RepID=UPI00370DC442